MNKKQGTWLYLVGVEHLAVGQEALVGDQHRVAVPALLAGQAAQGGLHLALELNSGCQDIARVSS